MIVILYILYFLYPLWFLGQLTTDNGIIFGILWMIHSLYCFLFTIIAWYFNEAFSFIVNILLIALCIWIYNQYLI